MKKHQAFAIIQAAVRLADDDTVLHEGSDLLKSMFVKQFPRLEKFVLTGHCESDKLKGIVADDDYVVRADDENDLYNIKVEGNGESITFRFLHEKEDEYEFFGADMR